MKIISWIALITLFVPALLVDFAAILCAQFGGKDPGPHGTFMFKLLKATM